MKIEGRNLVILKLINSHEISKLKKMSKSYEKTLIQIISKKVSDIAKSFYCMMEAFLINFLLKNSKKALKKRDIGRKRQKAFIDRGN